MDALQYIYTSWKNGGSTEKGYMIYSRSQGITEAECGAIKSAMQYLSPKELPVAPSDQEIADVFPYGFSYFILPTGRGCVAQSTYLGRDYSGRFGNYIIYALVFQQESLPCLPSELFAESYMKTAMTAQELEAASPVPPLPPLTISQYGSVINDDQLSECFFDKEEELAQVISMVLTARDRGIPFYLNDTRENLVLWASAIQRILPPALAQHFTFHTYVGDHEAMRSPRAKELGLDFHLIGVRPDANYFNYGTESHSSRHIVMDFIGGHMTADIPPSSYSRAMASSLSLDYEDVDAFGAFITTTTFSTIGGQLEDAYLYFRLLQHDIFDFSEDGLQSILTFGTRYCTEGDNASVGGKLLVLFQENSCVLSCEAFLPLWQFVCQYTSFMMFTLFDLLHEVVYQLAGESIQSCHSLVALLAQLQQKTPTQYGDYLSYLNSNSSVEHLMLYLDGHPNLYTNEFYIQWLLRSYTFPSGLSDGKPVSQLLSALLTNLCHIPNSQANMVEILFAATSNHLLFDSVLHGLLPAMNSPSQVEMLCTKYIEFSKSLPQHQLAQCERLLFELPAAATIASMLCGQKIAAAPDPTAEFWRFYHLQIKKRAENPALSVDAMVRTCLTSLAGDERGDTAIEMVRDLDFELLRDDSVIQLLVATVEGCPVKSLAKLSRGLLERTCQLGQRVSPDGLHKLRAVALAKKLDVQTISSRPVGLAILLADDQILLAGLDRADYECFLKNYFDALFAPLYSPEDVAALMAIFYHPSHFSSFIDDVISAIKKLEKRDSRRWCQLLAWACIYLVSASTDDSAAERLYPPLLRYLRSLHENALYDLRQTIIRLDPDSRYDSLFNEVRRKEGLSEKLGGIFRKK